MKRRTKVLLDILFYSGIAVFIVAAILGAFFPQNSSPRVRPICPVIVIMEGLILFVLTLKVSHKSYHLFFSLMFIIWGVIFLLIALNLIPYKMLQLWPFLGVTAGLSLLASGIYRYKKLRFGYVIPSIVLFGFGIVVTTGIMKLT